MAQLRLGKQDERGKDIWEDVFSLSKPLLNKMAMAAGIQFNPKETYGERIDRVTYRAQAQGAMRKADGTARTETDQKVICLEDEEEKYRIEFADKAAKGITDEKQAQAAAEIFSGQWVESKNKWGKKCQAFVVAERRQRQIHRSLCYGKHGIAEKDLGRKSYDRCEASCNKSSAWCKMAHTQRQNCRRISLSQQLFFHLISRIHRSDRRC